MRRSSRLAVPLRRPEDVIPHLGKAIHWKQGRSAKALADSWFRAGGIPVAVRNVLSQSDYLRPAEFLDGWLERETDLQDGRGTPSQSDLLGLIGIGKDLGVIGIEAKVDESFGPRVAEWQSEESFGKNNRLDKLCTLFRLEKAEIDHLRYQLLHRTAAVILEAQRFRSDVAVLIIQSFCSRSSGLADAIAFADAIRMPGLNAGKLVGARRFDGVDLFVGWAGDTPWDDEAAMASASGDTA